MNWRLPRWPWIVAVLALILAFIVFAAEILAAPKRAFVEARRQFIQFKNEVLDHDK